jgi:AraC family transcriptional regulator
MTDHAEHPIAESARRPIYVERVNAVIDYIEAHIAEELTLERLAAVAHFSPFHFHRVFGVFAGETVGRFIGRVRIERAATLLIQQPHRSITEVGIDSGFSNPSSFARAFRDAFGMSATQWREGGYQTFERVPGEGYRDVIGNLGVREGFGIVSTHVDPGGGDTYWEVQCGDIGTAKVTIEQLPPLDVAYIRHTGRYQGMGEVFADLFSRLMTWAQLRGLVTNDSWVLAVYHDNPSITDDDKLRVSACLNVPSETEPSGQIGRMRIDGGTYAVGHFELGETDYPQAWFALAGGWLPDGGYEPDDRYPFERYFVGRSTTSPEREVVDIWLPVRPLRAL